MTAVKALVQQARLHHCTFFSILYAVCLLSTLSLKHNKSEHFAGPGILSAVNLRDKGMLLTDRDVPSALGWNVLIPSDLARFVHEDNKPVIADVLTLAREINDQMKEQQDELPRIAQWGGRDTFTLASPETLGVLAQYVQHCGGFV